MAEHTDTSSTRSLSEATGSGDIAIVGLSFKLPQDADDDATFWNILENRRNLMTEWPESRVKTGSFLDNPRHKVSFMSSPGGRRAGGLSIAIVPRPRCAFPQYRRGGFRRPVLLRHGEGGGIYGSNAAVDPGGILPCI